VELTTTLEGSNSSLDMQAIQTAPCTSRWTRDVNRGRTTYMVGSSTNAMQRRSEAHSLENLGAWFFTVGLILNTKAMAK